MTDKRYCMSSYLALRYVEREGADFCGKYRYKRPRLRDKKELVPVRTAQEIHSEIEKQLGRIMEKYQKTGIMLSGGMDSAILASYMPGCEAYTFRFLDGCYQEDELHRAETFAEYSRLNLHYVDIGWEAAVSALNDVMKSKGGPVHSIEPQIYAAARQAGRDHVDVMVIGDGADYVFGGMDGLLSKDWMFGEFMDRYIYVNPEDALAEADSMDYLFERYRQGDGIDFEGFLGVVAAEESYGSYENAFEAAGMHYYDPYQFLKMGMPLDLWRIRNGESKYLIRELFRMRYPDIPVPEKNPMPRLVDFYFAGWRGPQRPEFRKDIDMAKYNGNQKWLLWCLEKFLEMADK